MLAAELKASWPFLFPASLVAKGRCFATSDPCLTIESCLVAERRRDYEIESYFTLESSS